MPNTQTPPRPQLAIVPKPSTKPRSALLADWLAPTPKKGRMQYFLMAQTVRDEDGGAYWLQEAAVTLKEYEALKAHLVAMRAQPADA